MNLLLPGPDQGMRSRTDNDILISLVYI